jgi:hypothetical protein
MTMTTEDQAQLIREVRELARTREHRIQARQLAALETQTVISVLAMRTYLEGRPVRRDAGAPVDDPGVGPFGILVSSEELDARLNAEAREKDLAHQHYVREQRPARVPEADRPQDIGYFLHDGTLFKVVRAIYGSGNLYAKRLDLQAGEFVIAKGMMSYLRESERITEAKAIEFGQSLEITPEMKIYGKCLICGRPLTDEDSIRNKVGPGPHKGL